MIREKNSRMSLCVQELFHPQDSLLNSCSNSGISENDGSSCTCYGHIFVVFGDFILVRRRVVSCCPSVFSHSIDAGMGFEPVLSCEDDVGDDESDELDEEDVVDKSGDLDRYVVFRITL